MTTNTTLFSTGYIAGQIKQSHEDTLKLLKSLGLKPLREVRTEKRMMRQWHKTAMYAAMSYIEDKKKAAQAPAPEPVQATLPLDRLEEAVGAAKEMADKMRVIPEAPKLPGLDITVMETKHAEEMMSVLRSIDQRLYELTVIWSK